MVGPLPANARFCRDCGSATTPIEGATHGQRQCLGSRCSPLKGGDRNYCEHCGDKVNGDTPLSCDCGKAALGFH